MNKEDLINEYSYIVDRIINKHIKYNKIYVNDIDDFRQVGLIALWKAIEKAEQNEIKNYEGYLYISVRNQIFKEVRKFAKLNKIELGECISLNQKAYKTGWEIENQDIIGKEDELIDLNSFFEELDNEEIKIINNTKFANNISEICRVSGLSRRKVLYIISETKRKLNKNVL